MVRHCKYEDRVEIHDPFLPRKPFTNSPIRGIIIRALFQKNNNGGGCKMKLIKTVDAEGAVLCHDITQIIKGVTKDAVFRKGHIVAKEDIPVLLSVGKDQLYVWEKEEGMLHENEAAEILCSLCKGNHMERSEVKEGKIELTADCDGLLKVDNRGLKAVNGFGQMMIATRHGNFAVKKGDKLAGTRIIPLGIEEEKMERAKESALAATGGRPILDVMPFVHKKVGIITTGNEVFYGRIKDTFTPVIEKALELGGYQEDRQFTGINGGTQVMTGFGHGTILSMADQVIDAVKSGAIRHFFLVAGCDGAKPGRNYYTDFVKQTPADSLVLTLACGKFRFNDLDLGNIGGLPRIMDMGQCNDAYGAIKVAAALAGAFGCEVNELPLSFVLSWYEQKAVCILLTLLHLGIRNIRLGPSLPAFLSPNILNFLVENYGIGPVTTPEEDLKALLG